MSSEPATSRAKVSPMIELAQARHGFGLVGVERRIGYKFGQWQDVVGMQRVPYTGE